MGVLTGISSRFNSAATALRHANLDGVYDTNTNMMFYPKIMQPTHARWEQIPPPNTASQLDLKHLTNGLPNGPNLPNGTSDHDTNTVDASEPQDEPTLFTPIPPIISRNFTILDTTFTSPPLSGTGYPGPDGHVEDLASGPNGLSSVPDEVVEELPEECRRAFEQARQMQREWKKQWGTEKETSLRGDLCIGLNGYPV